MAARSCYLYSEDDLQLQQQLALQNERTARDPPLVCKPTSNMTPLPVKLITQPAERRAMVQPQQRGRQYVPSAYVDPYSRNIVIRIQADRLAPVPEATSVTETHGENCSTCNVTNSDTSNVDTANRDTSGSTAVSEDTEGYVCGTYAYARPPANQSCYVYKLANRMQRASVNTGSEMTTGHSATVGHQRGQAAGPKTQAAATAVQRVRKPVHSFFAMDAPPPAYRHSGTEPIDDPHRDEPLADIELPDVVHTPAVQQQHQIAAQHASPPVSNVNNVAPAPNATKARGKAAANAGNEPKAYKDSFYAMDTATQVEATGHDTLSHVPSLPTEQPSGQPQRLHLQHVVAAGGDKVPPPPVRENKANWQPSSYQDVYLRENSGKFANAAATPDRGASLTAPGAKLHVAPKQGKLCGGGAKRHPMDTPVWSAYMDAQLSGEHYARHQTSGGGASPAAGVDSDSMHTLIEPGQLVRTVSGVPLNQLQGPPGQGHQQGTGHAHRPAKRHRENSVGQPRQGAVRVAVGHR